MVTLFVKSDQFTLLSVSD